MKLRIKNFLPLAVIMLPLIALVSVSPLRGANLGPFPEAVAQWSETEKEAQRSAGRAMLADLQSAVAAGEKQIIIPQGQYRFSETDGGRYPTHIRLPAGMEDVVIDFQGSTLWFETEGSGIVLSSARRTTIRNLYLDWDPLPFMQGTVVAIDAAAGTFDLVLDPGYDKAVAPLMANVWRGRGLAFDPKTRELKAGQVGCEVTFSWENRTEDGAFRLKFHGFYDIPLAESGIAVGDPYVVLRRMQRAIRMENTEDCLLEDVTLYAAPFIAIVYAGGGGPVLRRVNIVRRPETNRLLAGNADGINCSNMTKGPLIEYCRIETLGDDFVNVHGHLARVLLQDAPDVITTTLMNRKRHVSEPVEVQFFERATMRPLGRRMATWGDDHWKVDAAASLADVKHRWHSGAAAALAPDRLIPVSRLKLDRDIEINGDVIVICEAFSSLGTVIRHSDFQGSIARGLRLQAPDILVENNRIAITQGPAITLLGHASFWGEGPYVYNAVIKNNVFENNSMEGGASFGQRAALLIQEGNDYAKTRLPHSIEISENRFIDSGGPAVVARGVSDLTLQNNVIEGYSIYPSLRLRRGQPELAGKGAAIVLDSVRGLQLEGNRITEPGKYSAGDPVVKVDVENEG